MNGNWKSATSCFAMLSRTNVNIHSSRVSSQATNIDLELLSYWRCLFSVRLAKVLDSSTLIINIDETNLNYKTKTNYSWTQKGKQREFKSKPFSGSINMIFSIMSNGAWFWTLRYGATNSEVFKDYFTSLVHWIKLKHKFWYKKVIILLDNWSSHRAENLRREMANSWFGIWFLPQYSYQLAPIEKAF